MTIKRKLPLIIITLVASALITMSTAYYVYISQILITTEKYHMEKSLAIGATSLANFFDTRRTEVEFLSQNALVIDTVSDYLLEDQSMIGNYPLTNEYFSEMVTQTEDLRDIFIIEHNGIVLASSEPRSLGLDLSDRQYYIDAMNGKTTISSLLANRVDGVSVLFVATPIYLKNNGLIHDIPVAVMATIINGVTTSKSLSDMIPTDIGTAYLVDNSGTIIFHTDTNMVGQPHRNEDALQSIKTYDQGIHEIEFTSSEDEFYMLFQAIEGTSMILVLEQNMSLLHGPATQALTDITFIAAIVLFLSAFVAYRMAKTITNPIIYLGNIMTKTTSGDLTSRSEYVSHDELGILSKDLNYMLDELTGTYEELESKNDELMATEEELRINNEQLLQSQRRLEDSQIRIRTLAFNSRLTGMPNRLAYSQAIKERLEKPKKERMPFALYQLDLDNFMRINDSLGHAFGDKVLVAFANRLKNLESDTLSFYHLSADEFAYIDDANSNEFDIISQLDGIYTELAKPFDFDEKSIHLSASIGISLYPNDGMTESKLVQSADTAMFEAKKSGRSNYVFYRKVMSESVVKRIEIEDLLRHAIDNNMVTMYLQPQFTIPDKKLVAYEALMRIKDEDGKMISPGLFIPIAEETGRIVELGTWALRYICQTIREWRDNNTDFSHISVNVSGLQLKKPDFIDILMGIIDETRISPSDLELEVTESVLMDSLDGDMDVLLQLKKLGFKIALDDFGTGYSSFSYLRSMPLTTLKIDKAFIDNLADSRKDQEIIHQMIDMAHELGLTTIAEGVEYESQFDVLAKYQCDYLQGYYLARPAPIEQVERMIKQ